MGVMIAQETSNANAKNCIFKHFQKQKKCFFCQYLSFSIWSLLSSKLWSPYCTVYFEQQLYGGPYKGIPQKMQPHILSLIRTYLFCTTLQTFVLPLPLLVKGIVSPDHVYTFKLYTYNSCKQADGFKLFSVHCPVPCYWENHYPIVTTLWETLKDVWASESYGFYCYGNTVFIARNVTSAKKITECRAGIYFSQW